jgi:hypothetical protein
MQPKAIFRALAALTVISGTPGAVAVRQYPSCDHGQLHSRRDRSLFRQNGQEWKFRSKACNQHARRYTVNVKIVGLAGALLAFMASPAGAQSLTIEKARAIVAPFYVALNRPAGIDVIKLIEQATSPDWMTCGGNDVCIPREKLIEGFKSRGEALPDIKWEIKEILVASYRSRRGVRNSLRSLPRHSGFREKLQDHVDRYPHHRGRQDKAILPC